MDRPVVAVAGNPNAGKSSLFNRMTGLAQTVGNYPGVTVEKKEGVVQVGDQSLLLVDLPGTYSLTAYSADEMVVRDFILREKPSLILDVLDATNIERHLYLAIQLMELQQPMVLVLNMADLARQRGLHLDTKKLSDLFGIPVIETVGKTGEGCDLLLETISRLVQSGAMGIPRAICYGHPLDEIFDALSRVLQLDPGLKDLSTSWLSVKLFEEDPQALALVREKALDAVRIEAALREAYRALETHYGPGYSASSALAEARYGYAAGAAKAAVRSEALPGRSLTDQVDAVVCHRLLGPPILLAIFALMIWSVFHLAEMPLSGTGFSLLNLFDVVWGFLKDLIAPLEQSMPTLHSLIDNGVIDGMGSVFSFVPLIFLMFLFVGALEDSGYIARAAFILDRLLSFFGLQGRAFMPLLISGGAMVGCAVPGILATRTLRDERDRLLTILTAPLMNCGAKGPVYLLLVGAFFPDYRAWVFFLIGALSWLVALGVAFLIRKSLLRGEQTPFVMELPPYHIPMLSGIFRHAAMRTWLYLRKAGTVILAVSILFWALMYFPREEEPSTDVAVSAAAMPAGSLDLKRHALEHSFAGRIGKALEPISQLAGFDYRDNVALIGGIAAKEIIVSTLGTAHSLGEHVGEEGNVSTLQERLVKEMKDSGGSRWSGVKALAFIIFVMFYAPCLVTLATIWRETGKLRWAFFSLIFNTLLAFGLAVLTYQVGLLF